MIEVKDVSRRYGDKLAVDSLTFTVQPGIVTGFVGPNGAGKSTIIRMIMGLDRPSAGSIRVNGHRQVDSPAPLHEVGALLDAGAVHPGRSAYDHLLAMAATTGISRRRVDEVVELVGIGEVARKRVGGFSLGMGQRLGIAAALLGDPKTVTLDEPVNGLDPDGILWVRTMLKDLAAEGRTIFVSSHLMSEMALTAEHLVVVGRGRLIADLSVADFIHQAGRGSVLVRSPQATQLRELLLADGVTVATSTPGELEVTGLTSDQIGDRAATAGLVLHELAAREASLEDAFMEMTHHAVEYRGSASADRSGKEPS